MQITAPSASSLGTEPSSCDHGEPRWWRRRKHQTPSNGSESLCSFPVWAKTGPKATNCCPGQGKTARPSAKHPAHRLTQQETPQSRHGPAGPVPFRSAALRENPSRLNNRPCNQATAYPETTGKVPDTPACVRTDKLQTAPGAGGGMDRNLKAPGPDICEPSCDPIQSWRAIALIDSPFPFKSRIKKRSSRDLSSDQASSGCCSGEILAGLCSGRHAPRSKAFSRSTGKCSLGTDDRPLFQKSAMSAAFRSNGTVTGINWHCGARCSPLSPLRTRQANRRSHS